MQAFPIAPEQYVVRELGSGILCVMSPESVAVLLAEYEPLLEERP